MQVNEFYRILNKDFYTGVPDSQLKALCDFLIDNYGISKKHMIAANEGNCVALAAGYYMATGKIPVVYLQNSGIGNILNPVVSLLNKKVYGIPSIFIVGWRGEPGVHDEPQHIFQGEITTKLLTDIDIRYSIIDVDTTTDDLSNIMQEFNQILKEGKSVAFVIRKDALKYDAKVEYQNDNHMIREEVIRHIVSESKEDIVVCTTGKASRELFEIREGTGQSHKYDFLTVGSMGHSSSIALGIALNKPEAKVWCIDGDGAMLMHMGSMAVIGSNGPKNLIHIVINNGAHETVGGMPSVTGGFDLADIAKSCKYPISVCVNNYEELDKELKKAKSADKLTFIEVKVNIESRKNLGRPTKSADENITEFMNYLKEV